MLTSLDVYYVLGCLQYFSCTDSQLYEVGPVHEPILQMSKLKSREL